MNRLTAGSPAPAFELSDQNGTPVRLESFRGKKVLVYFYPKAMTPGCTTQACELRNSKNALEERNVVVLGISPDSPARLKKFETRDELNFTLLADEDHQVAEAFGVWGLKNSWAKSTMAFIGSVSWLMKKELLNMYSIISKPATTTRS